MYSRADTNDPHSEYEPGDSTSVHGHAFVDALFKLISEGLRTGRTLPALVAEATDLLEHRRSGGLDDTERVAHLLCRESLRAERQRRNLLRAAELQRSWAPPTHRLRANDMEIAGCLETAGLCGGDFWDARRLRDGGVLLAIGDAIGAGMDAALVVSAARGGLGIASSLLPEHRVSPANVLHIMSRAVRELGRDRVNMTCAVVIVYPGGQALCASAGHPLPYVLRRCGRIETIPVRGPVLGDPPGRYEEAVVELEANDGLFMCTDGVIEARDARGFEFGRRRLPNLLRSAASLPLTDARDLVLASLESHREAEQQQDDIAFLFARRARLDWARQLDSARGND